MKLVIWGLGKTLSHFLEFKKGYISDYELVAFVDNNEELWGTYRYGIPVISPQKLAVTDFDRILICSIYHEEIKEQLIKDLSIPSAKIMLLEGLEKSMLEKLNVKYCNSEDKEIIGILAYYNVHGISIYGSYKPDRTVYPVYRDNDNLPYVMLEGKRMYYPVNYRYITVVDGKEFLGDVLFEQKEKSPHLYVCREDEIKAGSVIVDAGVCEGNFALRYADKAKKIYLIESDSEWLQPLEKTFRPYKEKTIICNKFLTKYSSDNTITLDDLVTENIDFLKMDIEGAEIEALLGGKRILSESNARCSICSYHCKGDEENIKFLLEAFGYKTDVSQGYMFFYPDKNMGRTLDFRRGIVYGYK